MLHLFYKMQEIWQRMVEECTVQGKNTSNGSLRAIISGHQKTDLDTENAGDPLPGICPKLTHCCKIFARQYWPFNKYLKLVIIDTRILAYIKEKKQYQKVWSWSRGSSSNRFWPVEGHVTVIPWHSCDGVTSWLDCLAGGIPWLDNSAWLVSSVGCRAGP
jgi:hypothetical protein